MAITHYLPRADRCPASLWAVTISLLLRFHCWADALWHEISLCSPGVSGPGCVPSWPLAHLQPAHGGAKPGKIKGHDSAQVLLSNSQNTGLLPTLLWSQIQNAAPYRLLWRKPTPSQPDPADTFRSQCQKFLLLSCSNASSCSTKNNTTRPLSDCCLSCQSELYANTPRKKKYSSQNTWEIFLSKNIHINEDYKHTLIFTSTKNIRQRKRTTKYLWFQCRGKLNTWGLLCRVLKPPVCTGSADLWLLYTVSKILRRLVQRVCFTTPFLCLTAQFTLQHVLINLSLLVICIGSLPLSDCARKK